MLVSSIPVQQPLQRSQSQHSAYDKPAQTHLDPQAQSEETIDAVNVSNESVHTTSVTPDSQSETHKLAQDVIIQQLLKNRPAMNDVEEEFEKERQRRMYNMLRHSSHYKRIQVQLANSAWSEETSIFPSSKSTGLLNTNDLEEALDTVEPLPAVDKKQNIPKRDRRVSFSEGLVTYIDTKETKPIDHKEHLKKIPKDLPKRNTGFKNFFTMLKKPFSKLSKLG
ncbi:hypothetical protein HK103_000497 [Boothiomyces macroporosus]|uniref:Uncharacterized protein n=1 Tax=Boothiomyces macroporosus TaxID=261099 RepID=A0AAD5Y3M1_9FUNG|nr:hypothetical protein HK103_000497 [Boothiomyces macroporosus]